MSSEYNPAWHSQYDKFMECGGSRLRKKSLFEWLNGSYNEKLYLSSVVNELIPKLADIKTILCIVDVAVDDACDNAELIKQNGGEEFTYRLLKLLYNSDEYVFSAGKQNENKTVEQKNGGTYCSAAEQIFKEALRQCAELPKFDEFKNALVLALRDVAQSMEFSYLVNCANTIYPSDHIIGRRAASTMVVVHSIVDLMASPEFDKKELGSAISLFTKADKVAMLANTLNTWQREIIEKDLSSPVLALALERKILSFDDFNTQTAESLEEEMAKLESNIERMTDAALDDLIKFAENSEIKSFDALKFAENYSQIKEAFKARDQYWK